MHDAALFQEHVLSAATEHGAVWSFSRPDQKPAHFHGQLEFVIVTRGWALERVGHTLHRIAAGQLIWHLPGFEHELVESSPDLDLRVVHVEPDLVAATAATGERTTPRDSFSGWVSKLGRLAAGRPVVELRAADRDAVLESCDTPSTELRAPAEVPVRLRSALAHALRATASDHDDRRELSWVELASCALLERPWLERSALCRELDVSEGYLSRCFQRELGISFLEQRTRLRIVRFVGHVARDGQSMLDAALTAGFGSYSQLHRAFVATVGHSPRRYFSRDSRNARALVKGPRANPRLGAARA